MALSTSTGTLAVGASRTFNLSPGSALTLTTLPNCRVTVTETPNTVSASGVGGNSSRTHNLQLGQTVTYGPYPMGGTVVVANASNSGGAVTWVRSDALVAESASGSVSLVDGAGNTFSLTPAPGTVVTFGDSITALGNVQATPTAAVRASNVVTVTAAGHGLANQSMARVYGLTPTDFNTASAQITRIDANSFSYVSAGANGSATVDSNYARVMLLSWYSNASIFVYANGLLGGQLKQVANLGQSSETTAQMLLRLSEFKNYSARDAWILAGANDVAGSTTVATTIANLKLIYAAALASGKTVRAFTILPLGSSHASFATAKPKIQQINNWIKQYCRQTVGMQCVDTYAAIVDPASATGAQLANTLQADHIHPSTYGAFLVGTAVKNSYNGQLPTSAGILTCSQVDNYAADAANPNIWVSAPWTTSGGTISDVVSGTAADGFNVASSGNAGRMAVASVQARSDGYGYDQRVVFTSAASGDTATIQQESTAVLAARVVAGEQYILRANLSVTGVSGSGLSYLRCRVQGTFGGTVMALGTPLHSVASGASNVSADMNLVLESPPMVIPPGACTSLSVEFIAGFVAAGTALTMNVGRVSLDRVDNS